MNLLLEQSRKVHMKSMRGTSLHATLSHSASRLWLTCFSCGEYHQVFTPSLRFPSIRASPRGSSEMRRSTVHCEMNRHPGIAEPIACGRSRGQHFHCQDQFQNLNYEIVCYRIFVLVVAGQYLQSPLVTKVHVGNAATVIFFDIMAESRC